jgi:hypothetical protein
MVSLSAAVCPACGHPIADAKKQKIRDGARAGCAGIVLLFFGLIVWVVIAGGNQQEKEKANPTCVSDYTKCSDNKDLIEHHRSKDGIYMNVICETAAQESAKYGKPKFQFPSFGSFYRGHSYIDNGVAILVDDRAMFQNAFGADVHVVATCRYNLKADQAVVTVSASQ